MSDARRYVLDANILIEAQQAYYAFDICPGFWTELLRLHEKKRICSIDRVLVEIEAGHDHLTDWATSRVGFFKGTADQIVVGWFNKVVNWVQGEGQFSPQAKAEFATVADGWVIAYAKANGLIVVTHEVFAPDARRRVLIPNVCIEFDVEYCDVFEMLRGLRVRFGARKRKSAGS